MRTILQAAMLCLTAAAAPAAAESVSTAPLAPNEILVEIGAIGTGVSRAERASLAVDVVGRGPSEAEARRDHDARLGRLTAAARRAGVAATDIVSQAPVAMGEVEIFDVADAMADARVVDLGEPVPPAPARTTAQEVRSTISLELRDPGRVDALREALASAGADLVPLPAWHVEDPGPARRAARAQALAAARADAEAYAAELGLRVARIVRITERVSEEAMAATLNDNAAMRWLLAAQQSQGRGPDVPTYVVVGVDFALAPH